MVRAGSLIPAGQVWGGDPVAYVRELSEQEMLDNYAKSYANGASEFGAEFALWPAQFDNSAASGQTMEQYHEEKYFSQAK